MPLSMCLSVLRYFYAVLKTSCMFSSAPPAQLPFPGKLLCRNNHVFVPKAKCLRNAGALVIGVCQWQREERGWRGAGEDGGECKKGTVLFACTLGWTERKRAWKIQTVEGWWEQIKKVCSLSLDQLWSCRIKADQPSKCYLVLRHGLEPIFKRE